MPELEFKNQPLNSKKSFIMRNLNEKFMKQLTIDDVDKFGKFYLKVIRKHIGAQAKTKRMHIVAEQAKTLSLEEIIGRYKKLLEEDPHERQWQEFFDEFITLFDSRYQQKIDSKNISVGSTRYPDLILLDVYGFIDLYELKKCGTKLLVEDGSHNNYYWSAEISKTIAQVSVYLQEMRKNASNFADTILSETGVRVQVINPKAFIVAGTSQQLDTDKKRNQFKVLRESLKDVNFILYDELLSHLENLLSKLNASSGGTQDGSQAS